MFSQWFSPCHIRSEFLLLQFATTASCPFTVHFWGEPGSCFFITLPFWVVEDSSWIPHLVFSRLNKASSLSLSSPIWSCSPWTNVVACHWTSSSLSVSHLNWHGHVWNPVSSSGSQNAEWRGLSCHCWLYSYSTALRTLSPITKMTRCWLTAHLVDLLGPPSQLICSWCCWMELIWHKNFHLYLLNFMTFLPAYSSNFLMSLKMADLPATCQLLPFVPPMPPFLPR